MDTPDIEADYVVVGAGAAGMAFADESHRHFPVANVYPDGYSA